MEASWGLGEAVVAGMVTPDHWTITPDGRPVEARPGRKVTAVVPAGGGGTVHSAVAEARARELCLGPPALAELAGLGAACVALFGRPQDVEFAFAAGHLYLLQARPVTA